MVLLNIFKPGKYDAASSPEDYGFEVLDVEPPTEAEVVGAYFDYLDTGGRPIKVWERKVERLKKSGRLAVLQAELDSATGPDVQNRAEAGPAAPLE
jgi:hypothetical protein